MGPDVTARQLNPATKALLDLLQEGAGIPLEEMPVPEARAFFAAGRDFFATDGEVVGAVEDIRVEHRGRALEIRIYRPANRPEGAAAGLVYFHGGGWVLGDLDSQDSLCRKLCNASGVTILSVQYGHAPEAVFPVAIEEAMAAFDYISSHAGQLGLDPKRIAIGGESAGGNIATVVAQQEKGSGRIAAQLLLYPVTDVSRPDTSREPQEGHFVTARMLRWFFDLYLDGADPADPRISPLLAPDLSGLPPVILLLCGFDPLRQEGADYGAALVEAGVPVTTRLYPGQIHAFLTMDRQIPEAHEAIIEIASMLRRSLA